MLGLLHYFWRLVPANPILLRVIELGSRRKRDLIIRWSYPGLLILVVMLSLLGGGGSLGTAGLSELAQISGRLFQRMSYVQLALVALLAPVFASGAITQERDSQTYDILLSTPLTNGQIVLGSLLSRLFFVVALLLCGIPIFAITQIFGGVTLRDIALSFAIAAATAFITGALAVAVATFGVGTRRTLFSFYLVITAYLVGLYLLDGLSIFHPAGSDGSPLRTSWLTGIHPFLAMETLLDGRYAPPTPLELPPALRHWPIRWYWTYPAAFYTLLMFVLSSVIVLPSILLLRRLAGTHVTLWGRLARRLHLRHADRARQPRTVWNNPIAWREARTGASAARSILLRYGFMAAGLIAACIVVWMYAARPAGEKHLVASSYNPDNRELAVYQDDKPAVIYQLAKDAKITIDGRDADVSALNQSYAVHDPMSVLQSPAGPILTSITLGEPTRLLPTPLARKLLLGIVLVEFAAILLIVINAAASTVTREREDGTLDLLLATPITSRTYIWGKLHGLVSYVLPLVAIPAVSLAIFVAVDFFTWIGTDNPSARWLVNPESILLLPAVMTISVAVGAMIGMSLSLRCRTTVAAVMGSVGIMLGLLAVLGWCGFALITAPAARGFMPLLMGSLSPFTVVSLLIDPIPFGGHYFINPQTAAQTRLLLFLVVWPAVGVYMLAVWGLYRSMVKNFDMTIRKA